MTFPTFTYAHKPPLPVFIAATVVIFFSALSAADSVGLVPYYIDGTEPARSNGSVGLSELPELGNTPSAPQEVPGVLPVRIEIPAIGMDLPVQNSTTRDIDALYDQLVNGPIRYVDSAKAGGSGNVIIFGHSSRVPIVKNQMYKAFNRVSELKRDDLITLVGEDGASYLYAVETVVRADVAAGATIDLSPNQGKKLTLVTCDNEKGKNARFILTAAYVGVVE